MSTMFGALALLAAAVGWYSVSASHVVQRRHEIGIGVALGAQSPDVVRLFLADGLRVAIAGVAIGSVIAFAAAGYVGPLLFQVSPMDPAVFSMVALFWSPSQSSRASCPLGARLEWTRQSFSELTDPSVRRS